MASRSELPSRREFLVKGTAAAIGLGYAAERLVNGPLPAQAETLSYPPTLPLDELMDESTLETTNSGIYFRKTVLNSAAQRFQPSGSGRNPNLEVGPVLATPQSLFTSEQGLLLADPDSQSGPGGLIVASASVIELPTHDRYMVGIENNGSKIVAKVWQGSATNQVDERVLGDISPEGTRQGFMFLEGGKAAFPINHLGEVVGDPFKFDRAVIEPGEGAQVAMWRPTGSQLSLGTLMAVEMQDIGGVAKPQGPQS